MVRIAHQEAPQAGFRLDLAPATSQRNDALEPLFGWQAGFRIDTRFGIGASDRVRRCECLGRRCHDRRGAALQLVGLVWQGHCRH